MNNVNKNEAARNYLNQINENVSVEEGIKAIENILLNVYFKEGISNKELARNNVLPIPIVTAIKKEFIKCGLLLQDSGVRLTPKGKDYIEGELGFNGLNQNLYNKLLLDPWKEWEEILEIKKLLSEIFVNRPPADVTIDQSKCTLDTAVRRAILCLKHSELIGKKILCVGDDDLVSVALGFLLKKLFGDMSLCKTKIHVMDIDKRILVYISNVTKEEGLPINCEYKDFRQPLPKDSKAQFDCFFTDPPYTLQGMNLFLSRGVEALKSGSGHPIFLSYAHKSPNFDLDMQKNFMKKNLVVSEILNTFNTYEGAGIIGNIGQMIILKTTSTSKTSMETFHTGPIYTGELNKTLRSYSCKECGEIIKVGILEKFKTIEELKGKGCSKCQSQTFQLIEKNRV